MTQVAWLISVLMGVMIMGCAKTVEEQGSVVNQVESGSNAAVTGFFGSDVSLLQPGQQGQAAMVYINPNAQWAQYNKIMIEPVQFWDDMNTTVSPSDQHVLTSYFHNQLQQQLQQNFTIVDQGGPGTLQFSYK